VLLKGQLTEVNKNTTTVSEKFDVLETISQEVFDTLHPKYLEEKAAIEKQMEECSGALSISNLPEFPEEAANYSRKLNTMWTLGSINLKEDLQKLEFPEALTVIAKNQLFRTEKVNFIEKRDKLSYRLLVPSCGL
jgi:hypothetical protein